MDFVSELSLLFELVDGGDVCEGVDDEAEDGVGEGDDDDNDDGDEEMIGRAVIIS